MFVGQVSPTAPLLEEALVRARAELQTVGLIVLERPQQDPLSSEPWSTNPGVHGRLTLEQVDSIVRIEATAPGLSAPVVQVVDVSEAGVDAEVVAIRAVETLRAAMVQYAQFASRDSKTLPTAVGEFTRVKPAPPRRTSPTSSAPAAAGEPRPEPDPGQDAAGGVALSLWVAPEAYLDLRAREASGSGRLVFYGGGFGYYAGIGVRQTWTVGSIRSSAGEAPTRRTDLSLFLKVQEDLGSNAAVFGAAGGGYRQYVVSGQASDGYSARDRQHATAAGSLEIGAAQWIARQLALFIDCGISAALDAPELYFDGKRVARLDRPSLWVSVGVVAGQR